MAQEGCVFITGRKKKWNAALKRHDWVSVLCHKVPAPGSNLCPRHLLLSQDKPQEQPKGDRYY